jgi:hypothetical protein
MGSKRGAGVALAATLLLTSCGGSGQSVPIPAATRTPDLPTTPVTFQFNQGSSSTSSSQTRHREFIDRTYATQFVVTIATVNGTAVNLTTSYAIGSGHPATCSGSPAGCSLTTAVPTGLDNIQITLEDSQNRPLAQNNVTANVTQGSNTIYVTLNPIVAGITSVSAGTPVFSYGPGTGYATPVTIVATDADGTSITGPGVFAAAATTDTAARTAPLTLSSTDAHTTFSDNGGTASSVVNVSSPSDYVLLYHSGGGGSATATVTSSVNHALTASNTHIVPKWLYAASTSVQIFDTQNSYTLLPATIAQASNGMAFDLSGHLFMAVGNTVLEVDTNNSNATLNTLTGLSTPEGIAYDASTGYLYVANFANGANSVSVFNASSGALYTTISGTNTALSKPAGVAVSSNHHLYVANNTANTVTEYDLTQITATSWNPTPLRTFSTNVNGPIGVAVLPAASPNPGILFVGNNTPNTVTSYDTSTGAYIASLTLPGSKVYNLFLDTSNDYLYCALNGSKQIAVYQINSAGTSFTAVSNTPLSAVGAATSAVVQ